MNPVVAADFASLYNKKKWNLQWQPSISTNGMIWWYWVNLQKMLLSTSLK